MTKETKVDRQLKKATMDDANLATLAEVNRASRISAESLLKKLHEKEREGVWELFKIKEKPATWMKVRVKSRRWHELKALQAQGLLETVLK